MKEDDNEKKTEGMIVEFYGESLFHRSGQIENDGLTNSDTYVNLGDVPPYVLNAELNMRIKEGKRDEISEKRIKRLEQLIKMYRSTFRIGLRSKGLSKFKPKKTVPNESKRAVKVKVRRYLEDQSNFS